MPKPRARRPQTAEPTTPPQIPQVLAAAVYWRPIETLTPAPRNARTHPEGQLQRLISAIKAFGFTSPILVDEAANVLAGHGRLEAARRLGMAQVPTLQINGLTPAQRRAYVVADNRLAELAGWDRTAPAVELSELVDLGFEIELTGFGMAETDLLILDAEPGEDVEPPIPEPEAGPAVSTPGDLWRLGEKHRLFCGSALEGASYRLLFEGETAQMVFTDPPYNVPIAGHVSGLGKAQHREFAMASGEMTPPEFTKFLDQAFELFSRHSERASTHFICMDWRHSRELLDAARGRYLTRNVCVWAKDNAGMGSLYRSQHEFVWIFQNGPGRTINNVQLGVSGRHRTNIWRYPGMNSMRPGRDQQLAMHPTVKPVAMVADAILDCSNRRGIVLDPFAGSGTTILAAERTGRRSFAIEIHPAYVDLAVRRWQDLTGDSAVFAGDGRTFAEVATARLDQAGKAPLGEGHD
ncbi:site-specific DNA-methyltransferase [Neoroseomonas lacus]|uniref:Methyltransferase n=1 Tax=Neoroseomonas lacus TaxID=287609 RepID=A0A917KNW0_9PROT|nr:DNA methyltransferase [Neoroseomonas lacus]GGJ17405.1 methyltransferase [Neoroseomonas lacus]